MRTIYRTLLTPLALLATSALPATAQGDFLFDIDFAASSFDWGGTTSLGPMVTSPDTFNLQGTVQLLLSSGGNPVGSGQLTGQGDAAVVPDLHAEILAPWPLPPWVCSSSTCRRGPCSTGDSTWWVPWRCSSASRSSRCWVIASS